MIKWYNSTHFFALQLSLDKLSIPHGLSSLFFFNFVYILMHFFLYLYKHLCVDNCNNSFQNIYNKQCSTFKGDNLTWKLFISSTHFCVWKQKKSCVAMGIPTNVTSCEQRRNKLKGFLLKPSGWNYNFLIFIVIASWISFLNCIPWYKHF